MTTSKVSCFAVLAMLAVSLDALAIVPSGTPSVCVASDFSTVKVSKNRQVTLKLTNKCGEAIDLQNMGVTFESSRDINAAFTGDFGGLSTPDSVMQITSTKQLLATYLASFNLHFPGASVLADGGMIKITYVVDRDRHRDGTAKIYLSAPVTTGTIRIDNATAKPADVIQANPIVHVLQNGKNISDVKVPWQGSQQVPGLAPGHYSLSSDDVNSTSGNVYQGQLVPSELDVAANLTVNSALSYTAKALTGQINIGLHSLPAELSGYTQVPSVQLSGAGSVKNAALIWGGMTMVNQLSSGQSYNFKTASISFNNVICNPTFTPTSVVASDANPATTQLSYACAAIPQDNVPVKISGAPSSLASLKVTFTPNNGTAAISQTVALTNGAGMLNVSLIDGVSYTVSAEAVNGFTFQFSPQPLVASATAAESITLVAANATPVSKNGQLHVCGTHLCNERNEQIQLRGLSTHGLQWYGPTSSHNCLTKDSLDTLANGWRADIMRISMYVQEDGYETNPDLFTNTVNNMINEVSNRGMYAIVDWHMLDPGDPNFNLERAKTFFTKIIGLNKGRNNLLYEIANEPSGVQWSVIKKYAESLIPVIRALDPLSPILVGTPAWSSLGVSDGRTSQDIIDAPVQFDNIMYTFHFYAASHLAEYYNELDKASNVLPIFVTEFGTQKYTGDGTNDFTMSAKYLDLLAQKKISWTNWNYSDDKRSGAVWVTNTCSNGPWTDAKLKPAGAWIKAKITEGR